MRLLPKVGFVFALLVAVIGAAPEAKADPLTIDTQTGGFWLNGLGNTGAVPNGLDSLVGGATSSSGTLDGPGSFIATLNDLMFTVGYTGEGSHGSHDFSFSQPLTINGQTQILELFGRIDIGFDFDSVHILSATPLTFQFDTFSVDLNVIPLSILGGNGVYCDVLRGEFTVTPNCDPVPEPATLTLLGLGIAATAAKLRQGRKPSRF